MHYTPSKTSQRLFSERDTTYADLMICTEVVRGLFDAGYFNPSPIQNKAIPLSRLGLDLMVQVRPGNGKTVIFTVAALECVRVENRLPQVIILCPTKDLTRLTCAFINKIGKYMPAIICNSFSDGSPVAEDVLHLVDCQIAIGTPDRMRKLIEEGHLNTSSVRLFVLNEVDELSERGYIESVCWIYQRLSAKKQTMTFSGEYNEKLSVTIQSFMRESNNMAIPDDIPSIVESKLYYLIAEEDPRKNDNLIHSQADHLIRILSSIEFKQCVVYLNNTALHVPLQEKFEKEGYPTTIVDKPLNSEKKKATITSLQQMKIRIVITTDSSTLDLERYTNLVACFDVPTNYLQFARRVGRSGLYGIHSVSILIGTKKEIDKAKKYCIELEGFIHPIPPCINEDFYPWRTQAPSRKKIYNTKQSTSEDDESKDTELFEIPHSLNSNINQKNTYAGITIPDKEMSKYMELSKTSKSIRHLMETETWSQPSGQYVAKKIFRWRRELKESYKKNPSYTIMEKTIVVSTIEKKEENNSNENSLIDELKEVLKIEDN